MTISKELRLMIAKSDRGNRNFWLPFWVHSIDTANISEYIYRTRFAQLSEICEVPFEQLKKIIVLLGYLHDIGKLTELFQAKILQSIPAQKSVLEYYGIIFSEFGEFRNKNKSPHALCSESILLNKGFSDDFCSVVGAHHGIPQDVNSRKHMDTYPSHYYGLKRNLQFWNLIWDEWISFSLTKAGFYSLNEIPALSKKTQVLLSGLLIMSDWIASDQTKFNLIEIEHIPDINDYPTDRFHNAVEQLALPDIWEPEHFNITEEIFYDYFSFSKNEIQESVIKEISDCKSSGIFILEAPMGSGKTEAAFAAAEILAKKNGKTGVFIGLPTQATANGIFERTAIWAEHLSTEFYHSIQLAHANSYFQPVFSNIQKGIPQVDEDSDSGLVVHSFFNGRKQSCLADFVVGTVDQLLMCALKKKHTMLLHLGLSQKVVIIDECHAYDAYMNRYLDTALAWLSEYHVPVVLLSATLPEKRRKELMNAYLHKENIILDDLRNYYPQFTYSDGKNINQSKLPLPKQTSIIQIECMEEKFMLAEVESVILAGGCIGIICNTVSRAQRFADIIETMENSNVILYHAQYILPDRTEKEELLKKMVGKKSDISTRKGTIVIGTQVLEQSLDIDFDLLITDLCPMDLLLQRIGRLHRHKRLRPLSLENAKCIVLQTEEIDKASENIYSRWLLIRTKSLLPNKISLPYDIAPLVQETYKEFQPESGDERDAQKEYMELIECKKRKASSFLMGLPVDSRRKNNLHGWLEGNVQDQENIAIATVRDGISSVEVIILMQHSDKSIGLLPWRSKGERYASTVCPPEEECKQIAQQKIKLPAILCQQWNVDNTIRELEESNKYLTGFQKSSWLKGELCLILDEQLSSELMGFQVNYTRERGLSCIRKKEDGLETKSNA